MFIINHFKFCFNYGICIVTIDMERWVYILFQRCHDRGGLISSQPPCKTPSKIPPPLFFHPLFQILRHNIHLNDLILKINNRGLSCWGIWSSCLNKLSHMSSNIHLCYIRGCRAMFKWKSSRGEPPSSMWGVEWIIKTILSHQWSPAKDWAGELGCLNFSRYSFDSPHST